MAAPLLTTTYVDPEEGTVGWLVIDELVSGVAAGGLRVCEGITEAEVAQLARNMTRKQRAAGLRVGGAKAGLDMAPSHPARARVLGRFLAALKPFILHCWSVGPDMNTTMPELEGIAHELGIPSLKIAIGRNRGLADVEFLRRYALFQAPVGEFTVNALRPAVAVTASIEVLAERIEPGPARIAIQGAGNMGGAVAWLLASRGFRVVAWSDDEKLLAADEGLDVATLVARRRLGRLPDGPGESRPSAAILDLPCDVLVLAAVSRAFPLEAVARLRAGAVVEAANLALEGEVEDALHLRGITVVPDLVASVGGSLAVEALYEGRPERGEDILQHVARRSTDLVRRLLAESRASDRSPCAVAAAWASAPCSAKE